MPHHSRGHSTGMFAILLTCVALAPARAQTDEQLIRAIDSTWFATFNARDTVRLATFYAPDALGMYPNMAIVKGAPGIGPAYREMSALPAPQVQHDADGRQSGQRRRPRDEHRDLPHELQQPERAGRRQRPVRHRSPEDQRQWKVVNESVTSHAQWRPQLQSPSTLLPRWG